MGDRNTVKNPYFKAVSKTSNVLKGGQSHEQSSLASYAEKLKGSNRVPNSRSVRINTSFTPR